LTECWFDTTYQCYLNKTPSKKLVKSNPERFQFHRMDVDDVFPRMSAAIELINNHSPKNIILTVSPIPLEVTFTSDNSIMANSYSKSVLRIVAEQLKNKFSNVEYFPSYEIAISGGLSMYKEDNIHVSQELVNNITGHMLDNYCIEDKSTQ